MCCYLNVHFQGQRVKVMVHEDSTSLIPVLLTYVVAITELIRTLLAEWHAIYRVIFMVYSRQKITPLMGVLLTHTIADAILTSTTQATYFFYRTL